MDLNTLLLAFLIVVLVIQGRSKRRHFSATANDWFVVFDVDAEEKQLTLSFAPIVGFRIDENDVAVPITSRLSFTEKLSTTRPPKKVRDDMWGVSVSFGRWVRDDVLIDESGTPEMTDSSTFSRIVEEYLYGNFSICSRTAVPQYYQQALVDATKRVRKDSVVPM